MNIQCEIGEEVVYIRKTETIDGATKFRLITSKINRIYIGKNGVRLYADKFKPIDYDDTISSTKMLLNMKGLVLVDEVVLAREDIKERYVKFCERNGEK